MSQRTQHTNVLIVAEALAKANGISEEQAEGYLRTIGEKPELDRSGKVLVRDQKRKVVARLIYPSLGD